MKTEFYCNVDPTRKNYLIVSPEHNGRVHIEHDCMTDDELDQIVDYSDYVAVTSLAVGESFAIADGCSFVLRIA